MAANFFWYELMTSDAAAAAAFYGAVVGWSAQPFGGDQPGYIVVSVADRGIGGVVAMPDHYRAGGKPRWFGYVHVADVDGAVARLEQAGGSVRRPAEDLPGVGRMASVADPQGAMFVLMRPDGADRPPVAAGTPGTIGWRELHTGDGEQAMAFYADQFGWTAAGTHEIGQSQPYRLFAIDGEQAGGIMGGSAGGGTGWLYYINVDGIDAALDRVREAGGTVVNGPHPVPGGTIVAMCADPQGASFALVSTTP